MANFNLILVIALCAVSVSPAMSISRWFSSSYVDLSVTMRRFSSCGSLPALKERNVTDIEYLTRQIKYFLDQGNYDNNQFANVSVLMDTICLMSPTNQDPTYPISEALYVGNFSSSFNESKTYRCLAVEKVLGSLYPVFKRAAWNQSEPLDFSSIQFNNSTNNLTYNVTDLINAVWIKSDYAMSDVCKITDSVKDYVRMKVKNLKADDRSQQQRGFVTSVIEKLDRLLDPILGMQRRLYWEGSNVLETVSGTFGGWRDEIGKRVSNTRSRITGLFFSRASNSTTKANSTAAIKTEPLVISTTVTPPTASSVGSSNKSAISSS